MESTNSFQGVQRKVTLGSPTKQCSNGRILFPVNMPLTGDSLAALPSWVSNGFVAVSQACMEVIPDVQEMSELALAFSNDAPTGELFAPPSARLPGASLKGFKIVRGGDPDDPEIELHFKAYAPFTRDFWAWIGEMAGQEVYMSFPSTLGTVVVKPTTRPVHADPEDEADRLESLKPEHDEEFGTGADDMPTDPTLDEALGEDYESQVRKSLGAPEPMGDTPRLIDARPSKDHAAPRKKATKKILSVN